MGVNRTDTRKSDLTTQPDGLCRPVCDAGSLSPCASPRAPARRRRREGRQPRSATSPSNGRSRGPQTDVRRYPVVDRPAAGTAHARMRGQRGQMGQATTAKVRLDAGGAARFSASVQSTACFDRLLPAESAICRCLTRSKGRSWREAAGNLANVGSDIFQCPQPIP
jgi:hypothetical protein